MASNLDEALQRWLEAGIIGAEQAQRIRGLERAEAGRRSRWPAIVALSFGGIMLSAGILLFVSAHWDRLSPLERSAIVLAGLAGLHAAAAYLGRRTPALGVTLHAVGTVACGGAIFLMGQTFHLEEHWSGGIMLWAAAAWIGWVLLRQWPQLTMAAALTPVWLAGEWEKFARGSGAAVWQIGVAGLLSAAFAYLGASYRERDSVTRRALVWLGALGLFPLAIAGAAGRHSPSDWWGSGAAVSLVGWGVVLAGSFALGWLLRRTDAWVVPLTTAWSIVLVFLTNDIASYAWCALGSAGLVAWGLYDLRSERVNLGMAGFALTIVFFFFSSVMDKMGRSASLVALGVLFVAGGWWWEQMRRRLVASIRPAGDRE
jgi:uncharacterized membrane protein